MCCSKWERNMASCAVLVQFSIPPTLHTYVCVLAEKVHSVQRDFIGLSQMNVGHPIVRWSIHLPFSIGGGQWSLLVAWVASCSLATWLTMAYSSSIPVMLFVFFWYSRNCGGREGGREGEERGGINYKTFR